MRYIKPITVALHLALLFTVVFSVQASDMKGQEYIVQAGDHMDKLAEEFYDDSLAWPAIMEATNDKAHFDRSFNIIDDPEHLQVGQKLWIPEISEVVYFLSEAEIRGDISAHGKDEVHWGYEGETGPAAWGRLDQFFTECEDGTRQSPIDITTLTLQNVADIAFHYQPTALTILNNGHTIQVNYDDGSFIEVEGRRYALVQFHFHTPSEHTFAGQFAAMEMHLVHADVDGNLAVIGVMISDGKKNAALASVWEHLPAEEGPKQTLDVTINALDLLPIQQQTYRYSGSLTTPPCSEGVSWFVMTTPIEASISQVKAFKQIFKFNNRPVQPRNDRDVVMDVPK